MALISAVSNGESGSSARTKINTALASVDSTDINSTTGADTSIVTGTAGTNGNVAQWNVDGDVVDSSLATADIVTGSSTDTFTNKTFDAQGTGNTLSNVPLPLNLINGLVMSNDTDSDHDINITSGKCRDAADTANIILASEITKQIDANWVAGNDAGGFPSGLTLTADTTYHVFLIATTGGTEDAGFDSSLTATNLLADATGYTLYRRVGSVITDGSSNIIQFLQSGNTFMYADKVSDLSTASPANTKTNVTITAPADITVLSLHKMYMAKTSSAANFNLYGSGENDVAANSANATLTCQTSSQGSTTEATRQCTNSTISYKASTTTVDLVNIQTLGYIDLELYT